MSEQHADPPQAPADPPQAPRRGWTARLRGLSRTSKIIYAGAAVLLALVAVVSLESTGPAKAKHAEPLAKGFTLAELGHPGQDISLAGFAGKPVIVNFFASWCIPCKRETPLIARFYRAAKGRVIIVGIDANDETGPATRFVRAAGVSYLVGVDPSPAPTALSYGVYALPQTFFLNSRHRIVSRVAGAITAKELTAGVAAMDGGRSSPAAGSGGQDRS